MRRSAVLKDIPHDQLESALGNYLETGWRIQHAYPTAENSGTHPPSYGGNSWTVVTHWTVFLETDIPNPTEVP